MHLFWNFKLGAQCSPRNARGGNLYGVWSNISAACRAGGVIEDIFYVSYVVDSLYLLYRLAHLGLYIELRCFSVSYRSTMRYNGKGSGAYLF